MVNLKRKVHKAVSLSLFFFHSDFKFNFIKFDFKTYPLDNNDTIYMVYRKNEPEKSN
jgi:hypothetical protein